MEDTDLENAKVLPHLQEQSEDVDTNYSPNNPPWSSFVAVLVWIVSVAFIFIVPSLLLGIYFLRNSVKVSGNKELIEVILKDPWAIAIGIGGTFLAHIFTIALAWAVITKFNRYSFTKMLGWKWGGFKYWHALIFLFGVYGIALTLASLLGSHDNEMLQILRSSRTAVFLIAFLATFSAPIVEEVVYRGILYSAFQRTFSVPVAVFAVTFVFAMVHVRQYYPDFATIISILLLSLLLTLIRVKTDNLLPCIAFHFVFNAAQSALLILQPYLPEILDDTKIESLILFP